MLVILVAATDAVAQPPEIPIGTDKVFSSIGIALKWLANQQQPEGNWTRHLEQDTRKGSQSDTATTRATGQVLLAFLGVAIHSKPDVWQARRDLSA